MGVQFQQSCHNVVFHVSVVGPALRDMPRWRSRDESGSSSRKYHLRHVGREILGFDFTRGCPLWRNKNIAIWAMGFPQWILQIHLIRWSILFPITRIINMLKWTTRKSTIKKNCLLALSYK